MLLSQKEKEILVTMVANGDNTIGTIKSHIPRITEAVAFMQAHPPCLVRPVNGKPWESNTTLELLPAGEDILYQLKKERKQNVLNWIAAIGGAVGVINALWQILI